VTTELPNSRRLARSESGCFDNTASFTRRLLQLNRNLLLELAGRRFPDR
jgi:hypothetical protein